MLTPEAVKECLDANDVKYLQSPEGESFSVGWALGPGWVRTEILLMDGGEFVLIRTDGLPCFPVGHPARASLLERMNELGFFLRVVKPMLDPEDGQVVVTMEHSCHGHDMSAVAFGCMYAHFLRGVETILEATRECDSDADDSRLVC